MTSLAELKRAQVAYPIHPLLQKRWSPRAFAARPVEAEKLLSILEAARWSASSNNAQPWNFIVGTRDSQETFTKLVNTLKEGNAAWAAQAPVLILTVAKMTTKDGQPHGHALHDVGLAVQNLTIQAAALDLYVRQMAGFYPEKARELFHIPADYAPVTVLAIGYLGDPDLLDETSRTRELTPRVRKPLREFVFEGEWGRSAELVNGASR